MATPFSRTTRSMEQDNFLPSMIVIVLFGLLVVLWLDWFFTGELSLYVSTTNYQIEEGGTLVAKVPATALPQLRPGQQAELILPTENGKKSDPVPAEVMKILDETQGSVELYLFSGELGPNSPQGQLKIETGQTSPFLILWNTIQ